MIGLTAGHQRQAGVENEAPLRRGFLPEIQALRAIAVAMVVAYHLAPERISGGFIGVDVFFVISGFLITGHLASERQRSGRIRLGAFWARRIRRLLPAAFLVLLVCLALVWWLVPAPSIAQSYREIGGSALYAVNWFLLADATDYLAADNAPSLVQHYWSLSVEEQFYLAWPVLLVVAATAAIALARRWGAGRPSVWIAQVATISLVLVVSLAASIWMTTAAPGPAFFNTFGRAWEFAAGALVALLVPRWSRWTDDGRSGAVRAGLSWAGLVILAAGALLMDGSNFPGPMAAIPVVGTIMVILGGSPRLGWSPARLLAIKPVQWLGDVSYSVYLWHWPIIIIFPAVFGPRSGILAAAGIILVTLLLAAGTKRWVEDPCRQSKWLAARQWRSFAFAAIGSALISGLAFGAAAQLASQQARRAAQIDAQIRAETSCVGALAMIDRASCSDAVVVPPDIDLAFAASDLDQNWCLTGLLEDWRSCVYGDPDGRSGTVALVGDSHAASLVDAFDRHYAALDRRVETFLRFGCSGLTTEVVEIQSRTAQERRACATWSAAVIDHLVADREIDTVVFTAYARGAAAAEIPLAGRLQADSVVQTLERVLDSGKRVVVLLDYPGTGGVSIPTCLESSTTRIAPCSSPRALATGPDPLTEAAGRLSDRIGTVTIDDLLCDESTCFAVVGGVVAYADDNHLSRTFVRSLTPILGNRLDVAIGERSE